MFSTFCLNFIATQLILYTITENMLQNLACALHLKTITEMHIFFIVIRCTTIKFYI